MNCSIVNCSVDSSVDKIEKTGTDLLPTLPRVVTTSICETFGSLPGKLFLEVQEVHRFWSDLSATKMCGSMVTLDEDRACMGRWMGSLVAPLASACLQSSMLFDFMSYLGIVPYYMCPHASHVYRVVQQPSGNRCCWGRWIRLAVLVMCCQPRARV